MWQKNRHLSWQPTLRFQSKWIHNRIIKKSKKALQKNELSVKEKWLSIHLQKEITQEKVPEVSIRFIDEALGYGVFAEKDFEVGAFMGEYTGLVRKRKFFKDRKNDYCFEYTIGDWARNPFIIDAKDEGNITRFINHSEDPNLEPLAVYVGGVMHIVFVALKPIKKGTQLCYHYGDTFWKKRRHYKPLTS